ncbi:MAG: SDR family oxidoreductase [Deltaproteobacteria bacterium]|nr:SDR family oxidoreductase [Deltaproteobacteria bacterium]
MKPPIDGGTVLITGASSGIGLAIAKQLAGRAKALVLVARRRERLEALADELRAAHGGLRVFVHACDLSDRSALDPLVDEVERETGGVDILVNNAGFGDMGVFDLTHWPKNESMLNVNIFALTYLTHRLARPMVARGRGGILNVGSTYGLSFTPGYATYIGTKHFVAGFSESLRADLAGTGVAVTQLCPGPVKPSFSRCPGISRPLTCRGSSRSRPSAARGTRSAVSNAGARASSPAGSSAS